MKKSVIIFGFVITIFLSTSLSAQHYDNDPPAIPLKSFSVPMFGKDIIIHDQPDRDQRNISVCSAFNGWLYGIYSFLNGDWYYTAIIRSIDNGMTWEVLAEGNSQMRNYLFNRWDILVCGNTLSELRLFLVRADMDTLDPMEIGSIFATRLIAEPFGPDSYLFGDGVGWYKDIAIASDQNFPASNADPFSVGILYSKTDRIIHKDSLIFRYSGDGGQTFNNRRVITYSGRKIEKVALAYGRSASKPEGRYFAAWEEKDYPNVTTGHIYTAHTEPDFNSPFTKPICIDSLYPSLINKVRNPAISCQSGQYDNDSLDMTEVILFEKLRTDSNAFKIQGVYNIQPTSSNYFREFSLSGSSNNEIQPDICFNPFTSSFMVTYFDSTGKKLPFLSNNVNLTNPNSWEIESTGYNDEPNILKPWPRVELNYFKQDGINIWTKEGPGGHGISLFDAPYSTYTGITEHNLRQTIRLLRSFPNPCDESASVRFELTEKTQATISLYTILGQSIQAHPESQYSSGLNEVKLNTAKLPEGCYICILKTENHSASIKLLVKHDYFPK